MADTQTDTYLKYWSRALSESAGQKNENEENECPDCVSLQWSSFFNVGGDGGGDWLKGKSKLVMSQCLQIYIPFFSYFEAVVNSKV